MAESAFQLVSFRMVYTALAAFLGGPFIFGYSIGSLNVPNPFIKSFIRKSLFDHYGVVDDEANTWSTAFFSVAVLLFFAGGAISSVWSGELGNKFGRRQSVMIMQTFTATGAGCIAFCKIANSFELLLLGRLLIGIAAGCCMSISPVYGIELAPQRIRGAFGALGQLTLVTGIFIASVFTLQSTLGSDNNWPIGVSSVGFFGVLSAFMLMSKFAIESPKWLLAFKNDERRSSRALERLGSKADLGQQMAAMKAEVALERAEANASASWSVNKLLKSKQYAWPLALATSINATQQLCGINTVYFFAVSIYQYAGLQGEEIDYAALLTAGVNVLATFVSIFLLERIGRRTMLLVSMTSICVSLTALTVCLSQLTPENQSWLSWVSIAMVECFVVGFALGLGPLPIFSASELFPPGPRASASGFAQTINFLSVLIVTVLFENVLLRFWDYLSFLPFLLISAGFLIFFAVKYPETKNRSIGDIYHDLGVHLEEAAPIKLTASGRSIKVKAYT